MLAKFVFLFIKEIKCFSKTFQWVFNLFSLLVPCSILKCISVYYCVSVAVVKRRSITGSQPPSFHIW